MSPLILYKMFFEPALGARGFLADVDQACWLLTLAASSKRTAKHRSRCLLHRRVQQEFCSQKCLDPLSDPLAGSRASGRGFGMIVVLAGGHGVLMMALVGLPQSDLL